MIVVDAPYGEKKKSNSSCDRWKGKDEDIQQASGVQDLWLCGLLWLVQLILSVPNSSSTRLEVKEGKVLVKASGRTTLGWYKVVESEFELSVVTVNGADNDGKPVISMASASNRVS